MSQLKPWNIKNTRIIHKTPWIEVIEDTCLANDTELKYTYTRKIDEGPVIVAKEHDGSIWLVQQYRHPIKKSSGNCLLKGNFEMNHG